jgi:DNA-binding response OmpR family regulator
MDDQIDVLAIDDDKFVQKMIVKALESNSLKIRTADDGESGIEEVTRKVPGIILLDVEMPGINGYEVCDRLRNLEATKDIPIVFLSSHGSLRERLQGYEVGADDYIVKPFEAEFLLTRVNVLIRYHQEKKELQSQYLLAQSTAIIAMTGAGELAMAMRFLEKSLTYQNINGLAQGLLDSLDQLSLNCCAMIIENDQLFWYSSDSSVSPLEKELIEMCDKEARFLDFGGRTIINYPRISLLVKNMPLDDPERYGRIKDLIPILLSAVNAKVNALGTQEALTEQSLHQMGSFKMIRQSLFNLGTTIVKNQKDSAVIMNNLVHELSNDFLRMGLEEDQEEYLLNRVDSAIDEARVKMDAGQEIRQALTFILTNLNSVTTKQQELLDAYIDSLATEAVEQSGDLDDNVELF